MTSTSPRVSIAGLVITLLGFSTPAQAQNVTFGDVRDAVPVKFFNPTADSTRVDPADPNTLVIGFESGVDAGTFTEKEFRASTKAFGNRIASDTLSFNVVAPAGYYVSSITYEQTGTGSVARLADALGTSTWVINGQPASLGFFRTAPSLTQTMTFTDSCLTAVPVSITTSLFAFAPPTSGEATVELTGAKVSVTVAQVESATAKKCAVIVVSGYTGTYDGAGHGATGRATGVDGEDLSALLTFGETFTDSPGGVAHWTFAGDTNYNAATGTVAITIGRADATIQVTGFSGTYDGAAHGATGTATGVNNEDVSALLDLGATFTNVPGGTAHWTFGGGTNYHVASGDVAVILNKASPILSWPQPAPVIEGTLLTATHLNATANVQGTFTYSPPLGTVLTATQELSVAFTPADTVNYNNATATVTITVDPNTGVRIVNPGPQTSTVGDPVRLRIQVTGGSPEDRQGVFTAVGVPAGLQLSADGVVSGKATTAGTSRVTVTFTHNGIATSAQFDWTVLPSSK